MTRHPVSWIEKGLVEVVPAPAQYNCVPRAEDKANVQLIAAAPDLLEALLDLVEQIQARGEGEAASYAFDRVSEALDKATGGGAE